MKKLPDADKSLPVRSLSVCGFTAQLAGLKGKIPLDNVAVGNHNHRGEDLRKGWPEIKYLHKQFQQRVVEQDGTAHGYGVPEQLDAPAKGAGGKGDVFGKQEPGGKGDGEHKQECGDVRTDGHKAQVHDLLVEDKIVKHEIQENIQHQVGAPGGGIPESFGRDKRPEGYIHPIDHRQNQIPEPCPSSGHTLIFG